MVGKQRLRPRGTHRYSALQGVDATEPGKSKLKPLPRIHGMILLDETLQFSQPAVDRCPQLTITRGNDLSAGNSAFHQFAADRLNRLQPFRADVGSVDASDIATLVRS